MSEDNIFSGAEEEHCPIADMTLMMTLMSRPFGMNWPEGKMIKFLKARGYTIISRKDKETLSDYRVAVPEGSNVIDEPGQSNIKDTFISEVQDIILEKLLK